MRGAFRRYSVPLRLRRSGARSPCGPKRVAHVVCLSGRRSPVADRREARAPGRAGPVVVRRCDRVSAGRDGAGVLIGDTCPLPLVVAIKGPGRPAGLEAGTRDHWDAAVSALAPTVRTGYPSTLSKTARPAPHLGRAAVLSVEPSSAKFSITSTAARLIHQTSPEDEGREAWRTAHFW